MNTPARQPYIQTASNNNNDDDLTIVIIIIINNNFLINTHIFVQTFAMEPNRTKPKPNKNQTKQSKIKFGLG